MWGKYGGAEGDRTPGLRIANAALSQLSYCPISLGWRMESLTESRKKSITENIGAHFSVIHP
jgi:hypothetical protein